MSQHLSLGHCGSKAVRNKLKCLQVLSIADDRLLISEIKVLGWPELFETDTPGAGPWSETDRELHLLRREVDRAIQLSLRELEIKQLTESSRTPGWSAKHWRITDTGREWLRVDHSEFVSAVNEALAAIPVSDHKNIE